MSTYSIHLEENGALLRIAFAEPADNPLIVRDAEARLQAMKKDGELSGGACIRVNGPASLPVAFILSHHLVHLYQTVAVYDPKLEQYIVVSSHGGAHCIGDLID